MNEAVKLWEEVSREEVLKKYGRGIERVVFRLPNKKETDFYVRSGQNSIACLAITKEKQVILVKQFRPGPKRILLELPGGGIQAGESLEDAMARELLEETGYVGEICFVTSVLPDAYAVFQKNVLVATDCEKITEPKLEDNGEIVEAVLLSLEDFRAHIRSGQLTDVEIAYLGLDYLELL